MSVFIQDQACTQAACQLFSIAEVRSNSLEQVAPRPLRSCTFRTLSARW